MQRSLRISENQLLMLAEKARHDNNLCGYLFKKSSDNTKWQMRWFVLYQNLLLYYEAENSPRPSGIIFLEGCYCEKLITTGQTKLKDMPESQHCFAITYRQGGLRQYELCAKSEPDCNIWIDSIKQGSFNELLLQKEELEQKYLHLIQIVESEKTGKWQYTQQCEELTMEINKMRSELSILKRDKTTSVSYSGYRRFSEIKAEDSDEIKKIKKVQSFFRGWLCRRRWKQIVEEYIHSPHAENMRKRNSLVFRLVESEEEYLEQLELLVSCFLRPFKMAASSKKPPCTHDDVNSIFLNSETVMFLHQIFLKGLTARMENWPTLVLGDLFNMLLPMLCIYQEYVRNHHYSLQVLTECKQNQQFAALLKRLEEKPAFNGRSLESFLTYPMHQIPRYIITIHELLAHTPHNHVERKSLDEARIKLEELSRQMHDEVSETENIRKNLAIERMIVEGCDILLDVNQVFVRQGSLIQIPTEKSKGQWNPISSFKSEKEAVRQCYLFTNHLLLTTRSSGGRLHLVPGCGKLSLADTILIEDPNDSNAQDDDGDLSSGSMSSQSSEGGATTATAVKHNHQNHDFKLIVDVKGGAPMVVHLAASSVQEKSAWISDISHCMDNVHFNDLFHNANNDTSSVTMPQSIRNDPRLFKDDIDIRFSRTLNSCRVPLLNQFSQIRYATPQRLLDRLTDLRFLSIDFLNTFMLTYRVFTDGITVLEALKKVYYNPECTGSTDEGTLDVTVRQHEGDGGRLSVSSVMSWDCDCNHRRISSVSYTSEANFERDREHSIGHASHFSTGSSGSHWKFTHRKYEEEQWRAPKENSLMPPSSGIFHTNTTTTITSSTNSAATNALFNVPTIPAVPSAAATMASLTSTSIPISTTASAFSSDLDSLSKSLPDEGKLLKIPGSLPTSQSSETLTEPAISAPSSPSSITTTSTSTHTLVPSTEDELEVVAPKPPEKPPALPPQLPPPAAAVKIAHDPPPSPRQKSMMSSFLSSPLLGRKQKDPDQKHEKKEVKSTKDNIKDKVKEMFSSQLSSSSNTLKAPTVVRISAPINIDEPSTDSPLLDRHRKSTTSIASAPAYSLNGSHLLTKRASCASSSKRGSNTDTTSDGSFYTPRGSFLSSIDSPQHSSKAGVVVTSSRPSQRRSSTSSAAAAFAVATAGCSNPRDQLSPPQRTNRFLSAGNTADVRHSPAKRDSMMSSAATMRVLRVLRHWVSKHSQDFENCSQLMQMTVEFLEEVVNNVNLLPAEHKAATQLFQMITREDLSSNKVDLDLLLAAPTIKSTENIETLSALEVAEQMTFLDHKIFISVQSEEFLGQAWMKPDKTTKSPHIQLITKRFNDVSRLVVSEIIRRSDLTSRLNVIEKWAAVADICRCLHNFNGVLQICAAFVNSSVFRLKKTWEKTSKTTKQTVEKLQTLISSDCRFRNLREALHRCDPPCIPYLGMYLTDLSFIEEGTPNFTNEGLLNFAKMRMIAHVIREIRHFQQTPYKIEMSAKVTNYLLDSSLLLPDDELYRMSLVIEARQPRKSSTTLYNTNPG